MCNYQDVKKSYEEMWSLPVNTVIDIGSFDTFDKLYVELFKTKEFRELGEISKLKVLDLGAGKGSRLAYLLQELGAQLTAVDFVDLRQEMRYRHNNYLVADVLNTGIENGSMDIVISANVFLRNTYLREKKNSIKYVSEVFRILKNSGIFWGEEKDLSSSYFMGYNKSIEYEYLVSHYVHYAKKGANNESRKIY